MALTHVFMWTDNNGWVPITAEEATRIHPGGTVSARSGLFRCGLCYQMVTLADGPLKGRFFKHSRGDIDKECVERSVGPEIVISPENKPSTLPMRLSGISKSHFSLEIGFVLSSQEIIISGTLSIQADDQPALNYNVSERLDYNQISYLNAGSRPALEYRIYFSDEHLSSSFPKLIKGINGIGALFDGTSYKRLPNGAVVSVNRCYLLLTTTNYVTTETDSISLSERSRYGNWKIYDVTAKQFNQSAAEFFMKFHCLLSEKSVTLFPIYPTYVLTPYLIHHRTDTMCFYIEGQDVIPRVFPNVRIHKTRCADDDCMVVIVNSASRQQIVSIGKMSILRYTYLWKDSTNRHAPLPSVEVHDIMDQPVMQGESMLPKHSTVMIRSSYDGYVEIIKDGFIIEKLSLKAETPCEVSGLQYGESLRVLQGADCVYQVEFRKIKLTSVSDDKLYQKLMKAGGKMIPVSHRLGSMAAYFYDAPDVKKWLYQRIRAGMMPEEAYKLLKDSVKGMKK